MNKNLKKFAVIGLVGVSLFFIYRTIAPKAGTDSKAPATITKNGVTSAAPTDAAAVLQKNENIQQLLALLLSVNNIHLSTAIFSMPAFQSLKDFSISEEEQKLDLTLGRKNPFLPIGDESSGAYATISGEGTGSLVPLVKTNLVTQATIATALLVGENTSTDTLEQYFEWGTTGTTPLASKTPTIPKTSSKTYSYSLTGLLPNTVYFYRAVVKTKDSKLIVGDVQSFKTLAN